MFWFFDSINSKAKFKVLNNTDDNIFLVKLFSKDINTHDIKKSLPPNYTELFTIASTEFSINEINSTSLYILFTDPIGIDHKFLVYENLNKNIYVDYKIIISKSKLGDFTISCRDLIKYPEF